MTASAGPARPALIGEFLAPLARPDGWAVLDMGPLRQSTLSVCRGLRCRLGIADALGPLAEEGARTPADATLQWYALREHVPADPQRPWDRVFLWGLLDYLPDGLLAAFLERLTPALSARARLHALVMTPGRDVPATPPVYELVDAEGVVRIDVADCGTRPAMRTSPPQRRDSLPGLVVDQSRLHVDGRHEVILRAA